MENDMNKQLKTKNHLKSKYKIKKIRKGRVLILLIIVGIVLSTLTVGAINLVNDFKAYVKQYNEEVYGYIEPTPETEPEIVEIPIEKEKTNTSYEYDKSVPELASVDENYFDDAIFIGNSRTEGLILFSGIENGRSLTHKGLKVDTIFTNPVINKNGEKISVMDALKTENFSKVYIMLGLNETGWPYSNLFIEKYTEVIKSIKAINQDAIIYVQSILPVSEKTSKTHDYVKKEKIDEYNTLIKKMCAETEVYYINVAEVMMNDSGYLPETASTDGIHLSKEYCVKWLEYLKTHSVKR